MNTQFEFHNGAEHISRKRKKRKRDVLTIEKKLEIIKELKNGVSASSLSVRLNVPRTTINDIKKNAEEIEKYASQMESLASSSKKRKTMRKATDQQLDQALYLWFIQKRAEGVPLSGPIIQERALFFNEKLNVEKEFKASSGWLHNFKNRHGIRELNIEGEKLSAASIEIIDKFKSEFQQMIENEGLTREQVFNGDETGLNYKALPTKTLAAYSEKYAPGHKMQKQRVTLMVCANASGGCRLPLTLIGTAKKPRCFKTFNMNALPVTYYAQKNAWMSQGKLTNFDFSGFHTISMNLLSIHKVSSITGFKMFSFLMFNGIYDPKIFHLKLCLCLITRQVILKRKL